QLIAQLNRLKAAKTAEAEADITRLELSAQDERLANLEKFLTDQNALIDAARERRINRLEREASEIKVVDEESFAKALAIREEIIAEQGAREVEAILQSSELYLRAQEGLQAARIELNRAGTDEERRAAEAKIAAAKEGADRVRTAII